jgi:hypothetical protein
VSLERGFPERAAFYGTLRGTAREIDSLKKEYEALVPRLRTLLERGGGEADPQAATEVVRLMRRGQWLCDCIEERYLKLFYLQERQKLAWLEEHTGISFETRDEATVYVRQGIEIELSLAHKERAISELRLAAGGALEETPGLREKALRREIQGLHLERELGLATANLRYAEWNLKNLPDADDPYRKELFAEDVLRSRAAAALATGRRSLNETWIQELRAREEGRWQEARPAVVAARARAERQVAIGELEVERVEIQQQQRWARYDAEDATVPGRRQRGKEELERLGRELETVDATLRALREESAKDTTSP